MSTIEVIDNPITNTFLQEESYQMEEQSFGFPEEIQYSMQYPHQLSLFKKQSHIQDLMMQEESNQDIGRQGCFLSNKNCYQSLERECTTAEHSWNYPEVELQRLTDIIEMENKKFIQFPKNIPAPSDEKIQKHLNELNLRFAPVQKQQEFLNQFIQSEELKRIQIGLCDEILNEKETQKFEDWVEQLCTQRNHHSLKELRRKKKVKRYLEKKHNRTYEKKVHYQIRQKVAEERLRVKGRFVTWNQALKMLNYKQEKKHWTYKDYNKVKEMLHEKFGANRSDNMDSQ